MGSLRRCWAALAVVVGASSTTWSQSERTPLPKQQRNEFEQPSDDQRPLPSARRRFGPGSFGVEEPEGPRPRQTEGERKELLTFIRENFPGMADELDALKERRPEAFEHRMRRLAPDLLRLMDISRTDPPRGQLLIQERKLEVHMRLTVRRYHQETDEARKTALREDLRKLLGEAFDCREQRRALEIRDLEARISELKDEWATTSARREQIIDRQMDEHLEPREHREDRNTPDRP